MVFTATAQKQTKYYLIPQAALLNGDHACNAQLQLVGGIQKKQWGFGAGLGIDYYKVRTIPLFVDTRFFFGKERQYFSYFNLGYNIASPLLSQQKMPYNAWTPASDVSDFQNGLYTDMGIGCTFNPQAKRRVMLSAGYALKTITEHYNVWPWTALMVPGTRRQDNHQTADYLLNYFSLKLGVSLW